MLPNTKEGEKSVTHPKEAKKCFTWADLLQRHLLYTITIHTKHRPNTIILVCLV